MRQAGMGLDCTGIPSTQHVLTHRTTRLNEARFPAGNRYAIAAE